MLATLRKRPLLFVGSLTLAVQVAGAAVRARSLYVMPNSSLVIAHNLLGTGQLAGGSWIRLKGNDRESNPPLRAYHLPGESIYLAAGLAAGEPVFSYWHVPVAALLVCCAAWVALLLIGADGALIVGVIAALDPFITIHGPVYDDAILGAALLWFVFAVALKEQVPAAGRISARRATLLAVVSAYAAVTRSEIAIMILAMCALAWIRPRLGALRVPLSIAAAGVVVGVGIWAARNEAVLGHPLLGSTHDGLTLWESTAPSAEVALHLGQVDGLSTHPAIVGSLWEVTAPLDEVEADAVFRRAALANISREPWRVAKLGAYKVALSLLGVRPELPIGSRRNLAAISLSAVLLFLAIVGLLGERAGSAGATIDPTVPTLMIVVTLLVLVLGPVGLRYWVALRPLLWVASGGVLCSLLRGRRAAHQLST